MQLVKFKQDSYRQKAHGVFYTGVTYLLHDRLILNAQDAIASSGFDLMELQPPPVALTNWHYPDPCDRLLVYVTGKIGDMLWLTAVFRRLKELRPRMQITVVTAYPEIFDGNTDVTGVRLPPIPFAALDDFDGYVLLDEPIARRRDVLQKSCYEILFRAFGLPWDKDAIVTPNLRLTSVDEETAFASFLNAGDYSTMMHLVLGLHSSSRTRNLPPYFWRKIVDHFATLFKHREGFYIYGISDSEEVGGPIQEEILGLGLSNYTPLHNKLNIRQIAAIVRTACCVISVDSMLVHLAAAMNTACVPIMTTVPPNVRTSTYPLARPIWKGSSCEYAPCFWKENDFRFTSGPRIEVLPCYTPERRYCEVALGVTVEDVEKAFGEAVQAKANFDHFQIPDLPKF